jgi:hypothetical protein
LNLFESPLKAEKFGPLRLEALKPSGDASTIRAILEIAPSLHLDPTPPSPRAKSKAHDITLNVTHLAINFPLEQLLRVLPSFPSIRVIFWDQRKRIPRKYLAGRRKKTVNIEYPVPKLKSLFLTILLSRLGSYSDSDFDGLVGSLVDLIRLDVVIQVEEDEEDANPRRAYVEKCTAAAMGSNAYTLSFLPAMVDR